MRERATGCIFLLAIITLWGVITVGCTEEETLCPQCAAPKNCGPPGTRTTDAGPCEPTKTWPPGTNHPNAAVIERIQQSCIKAPYTMVLIGDTRPPGMKVFAAFRKYIAEELTPRPKFAILDGDFVGRGTLEEYQDYIQQIETFPVPLVSVIGNHEIWDKDGMANFRQLFGCEDFHFDVAGCRFIAVNNNIISREPNVAFYDMPDQALRYLEQVMYPGTCNILVMHVPPYLPYYYGNPYAPYDNNFFRGPPGFNQTPWLTSLMEDRKVKIGVFGHVHSYGNFVRNGVRYLVTGGGGAELGMQHRNPPPGGGAAPLHRVDHPQRAGRSLGPGLLHGAGQLQDHPRSGL